MKNTAIAFILILCVISSSFAVAASEAFEHGYGAGEILFTADFSDCNGLNGGEIVDGNVVIPQGASASFAFYLPFDARSVTIKYSDASGVVDINSGYRSYSLELSGEGEYILEFGAHLGYEPQNHLYTGGYSHVIREFTERSGEREFVITAHGGITIDSLVFEKEKIPYTYSKTTGEKIDFHLPDVSENTLKTATTVMIDVNAPVIYVNGGRRYVDNNDTGTKPYNNEGTLYLPVNTLAKALGYYCEDMPDKAYVLLRDGEHEFTLLGSKATLRTNNGTPARVTEPAILYRNGKTWAAVRYFAELSGKTVGYRDGLAVIDDKYTVSEVLSDDGLHAYALSVFSDFKADRAEGNVYYVAQTDNASDLNTGSSTAPFKTIGKAASIAEAGDTVIIRDGIYRETLSPANSGTPAAPITFRAEENAKVVISAGELLSGISHYSGNIYTAPMSWDMGSGKNQIFINGKSMTEARYPNAPRWLSEGLSDLWPTRGSFKVSLENSSVITSEELLNQTEDDYWKGAYYVGAFGYSYALSSGVIESSRTGEITVKDTSTKWWWTPTENDIWNYGCIIGHMNALDAANEWVKQENLVYLILPDGVAPEEATIEAKARQLVIDVSGKKFINIEGIDTIGGSVNMNNSEMCMLNGLNMKYITHYTLSNDQRDGYIDRPYNLKNSNGAPQRGEVGIYVGGTDNIIVNSNIDHSAGAGIYGTGLYTYIENNILKDCGYMGSYVSGINFNTAGTDEKTTPRGGHAVYNNTVYNCGRSCLNIGQIEGVGHIMAPYLPMEIAYNDFHDGMLTTLDTGIIYDYYVNSGLDKNKTKIHHNYVYTTHSKADENPFAFGIYHDGGSFGTQTYDNIVFNVQEDVVYTRYPIFQQQAQHAPAFHAVYNNRTFDTGIGSADGLLQQHFPQGKMFYAGAAPYSGDYLSNYTAAVSGAGDFMHCAANAILSDGMILEKGIARFTGNEQYICFENVDFGTGADTLNLTVYGDKNYSCDELEIVVGGSIDEVYPKKHTIQVNSPDLTSADNVNLNVGYITGTHNVYIRMKDFRSLAIGGISVSGLSARGVEESGYSARVYAADYTGCVSGRDTAPPTAEKYIDGNYTNYYIKDTWGGTVLTFEKVRFRSDAASVVFAAGSNGVHAGQPVSVYIDSLESQPVATYTVDKTAWNDFTPVEVDLSTVVDAGVHTIYLKFDDGYKTSNVYYFGFLPENQ